MYVCVLNFRVALQKDAMSVLEIFGSTQVLRLDPSNTFNYDDLGHQIFCLFTVKKCLYAFSAFDLWLFRCCCFFLLSTGRN